MSGSDYENSASNEGSTISELLDKCLKVCDDLENTDLSSVSQEYQGKVKTTIETLENLTHTVNSLCMFSTNETIDEIPTLSIKFLLLPVLLGHLNLKLKFTTPESRLDELNLAQHYLVDFLTRCKEYEASDVGIPTLDEENNECSDSMAFMQKSSEDRDSKVKRFLAMKNMMVELKQFTPSLISSIDEETQRRYYLILIKRWSYVAYEELLTINVEKFCLRARLGKQGEENRDTHRQKRVPFKPIILVKSELQKKVYGAGYPSLPTLTVDEFYAQRYPKEKSSQPVAPSSFGSLQERAADSSAAAQAFEAEDIENEQKIEKDDPIALMHARAFDDWKDDNRRGCGNRKNMG